MVKEIACFLTCGYTESGAMQSFLKKINPAFNYRQWLPNKTRKRKGDAKNISASINGLTGESLLIKVCSIIFSHRDEIAECSAIVYEDDLDGRFQEYTHEQICVEIGAIKDRIVSAAGKNIPVFVILASPEIESWFLADWDGGFGFLCRSNVILKNVNSQHIHTWFEVNLRKYINTYVLREYQTHIEDYGFFDGEYIKLSDMLIDTLQNRIIPWLDADRGSGNNPSYLEQIKSNCKLCYSKRLHGDLMLHNIDAAVVARHCSKYFRAVYSQLKCFVQPA